MAELLVAHGYSCIFKHPFICTIERLDGTLIELDKLRMTTYLVQPGDIIGIRAVMTKGGGKNPLGMVLQIAMMVAAYYIAPYLAVGFESMGMSALAAAGDFATFGGMVGSFMVNNAAMLATGALGMVSLMASSFLVGPQSANNAGASISSESTNTYYSITGSSNKVNKFGCIPYVLGGTVRVYPSHACEPYTEVINNIEYIRQIFVLYGPVKISDIRLGDTPISDYTNYDIEVLEGWATDPKPSLYSTGKDYHQVNLNLTLKKSTGRVVRHIENDCDEIMFDVLFTSGLYNIHKTNGSKSASTAEFVFEYKLSSSNTWIPWGQLNVTGANKGNWAPGTAYKAGDTVLSPDGVVSKVYLSHISANYPATVDRGIYTAGVSYAINDKVSYGGNPYRCTITHVAQAIAVDAAGVSTGGFDATKWVKIAANLSELFASDSTYYTQQSTTISGKLDPGAKQTFRMCAAKGSYDIAWTRITDDDTTGYKIDRTTIATLRSIAYRDPINWNSDLPPLASVSVRMQGTDQLSGIISDLNFLASPYLPVYDSVTETWSYQLSDNPAWAYLSPLRGPGIQEPIPYDEIDLDTFVDWAAWNTSMGFKINGLIDTQRTLQSILKDIAFCGRATPGMRDNLYSVVVDKPDSRYAQIITPRNSWNFQGKKQFPDNPHALRVTFNNQDKEYQQDERYVYAPGYTESTATLFETLDLTFITDADNAYQQGLFQCAQVKHRPEEFTVYMDAEHLRCTRGDRIKVQHDVILIGQGAARIKVVVTALNPDNGVTYVTDMVLDNKFIMEAGKNYAVGVRYNNGDLITYGVVNIPGESNVLKFSAPPPVSLSPKEDNIVWFGEAGKESEDCRIMSITPGADLTAQLTLRHYSEALMSITDGVIPPFDSKISSLPIAPNRLPGIPVITRIIADENSMDVLPDGTILPRIRVYIESSSGYIPTDYYAIQYKEHDTDNWITVPNIPSSADFATITNITDGTTYDIRIAGINNSGASSNWSYLYAVTVLIVVPIPDPVPSLTCITVQGNLQIDYGFSSGRYITGYDISINGVVVVSNHSGNRYNHTPEATNTFTVGVRSRDIFGQTSTWVYYEVAIYAPAPPTVSARISGRNIEISWTHNLRSLPLASSEILHGDTLAAATSLSSGLINTSLQVPGAAGSHRFWVRDTDAAGNTGPAGMVELIISAPGMVAITPQVIDNNVLLAWTEAKGTLPIADCELRRGATYAASTLIGRISGRFATMFETVSGNYTYWITQRDVAGNDGAPASITVQVSQPLDYVLRDDFTSVFSGTIANALLESGGLVMPVNTTSTVAEVMAAGGWATRQDKITAGLDYRLEPTPATSSYQEVIDYGTTLSGTKISVITTSQVLDGSVSLSCRIEISVDGAVYTDLGEAWQAFASNFRYCRITITATPDGGSDDLLRLSALNVKLDVKNVTDSGSVTCSAADPNGTRVPFNLDFLDVNSIVLTSSDFSVYRALYSFVDIPHPTGFFVLLYDSAGSRVSGNCSWQARGAMMNRNYPAPVMEWWAKETESLVNGTPDGFTFTRASAAYRTNASGYLESVASGTLRHDYALDGTYKGWLIEGSKTNYCLWNRDLTNALWAKTNCTAAKDQTGPDNVTSSCSTITATSANATILQARAFAAQNWIPSAYLKRITGTGAVSMTVDGGTTWTDVTAQITVAGPNGFSRVRIPYQNLANPSIGFKLASSGDAIAVDLVQNEISSTDWSITSPIATTSAGVTRAADVLSVPTASISGFSTTEGCLSAEFDLNDAPAGAVNYPMSVSLDAGTLNNRICLQNNLVNGVSNLYMACASGGTIQVSSLLKSGTPVGVMTRAAFSFKADDFKGRAAGRPLATDAAGAIPAVTQLQIGRTGAANHLNGHVKHFAYFNRSFSAEQIAALLEV